MVINFDKKTLLKATILLTSSLSVLCTGVVSPALPTIGRHFADVPNISLMVKMMVTIPNFFIGIFAPFFGYLAKYLPKKRY
jgi:MFS family permease